MLQLISIAAWVVAQVPQFIDNWKNESAEALSPWFLAEWFMGDASNLLGCMLTGVQLPLTSVTAVYFVMCDVVMLFQYTFYAVKSQRRLRSRRRQAAHVARESLRTYDAANAYAILHPDRHYAGYQGTLRRSPGGQMVHSVPSAFLPGHAANVCAMCTLQCTCPDDGCCMW